MKDLIRCAAHSGGRARPPSSSAPTARALIRRLPANTRRGTRVPLAVALALSICALPACGSSTSSSTHAAPAAPQGAPATAGSARGASVLSAQVKGARTRLGTIAYRVLGSGPPLVLVNGIGASMEDWYPALVDHLAHVTE